jgi:hypothetical protein
MKQWIITLFISISISSNAQTEEIDSLCYVWDISIAEAEEAEDYVPVIRTNSTLMKRAIGAVEHRIIIYFDEHELEIGQEGQDVFHKEAVIRKAYVKYYTPSCEIHLVYYFDEGGILIKYSKAEEGYLCQKKQVYFKEESPIRTKQGLYEGDWCEQSSEDNYDRTQLTKEDKVEASWIQEEAKMLREILFLNYELIKN